jgi:hypothetical protein
MGQRNVEIVEINGSDVPVVSTSFQDFGYLTVEVGTNGDVAGSVGDSSVTSLTLRPTGSFFCRAALGQEEVGVGEIGTNNADSIRIVVHGDGELRLLLDALRFAVSTLEFLSGAPGEHSASARE